MHIKAPQSYKVVTYFVLIRIFLFNFVHCDEMDNVEDLITNDWSKVKLYQNTDEGFNCLKDDNSTLQTKIVDGKVAGPQQIPYQVGILLRLKDDTILCGGALISRHYVLTAAHCLKRARAVKVFYGARSINERGVITISIPLVNLFIHPDYDVATIANDIALIELPRPARLNRAVQTIKLPRRNVKTTGRFGITSGWGKTRDKGQIILNLRFTRIRTITFEQCALHYKRNLVQKTNICSDGLYGNSVCQGDSGGPLVVHEQGVKTLIGIVSFVSSFGCELKKPAVFTRVSAYLDWIEYKSGLYP